MVPRRGIPRAARRHPPRGRPADQRGAFYLAVSEAYDQALAFVDGMPDDTPLLPTFRKHRAAWDAFIDTSDSRHVRVAIPCGDIEMPGYLLRPMPPAPAVPGGRHQR